MEKMSSLDAVETVLNEIAEPIHYEEITQILLERGLWETQGKTPAATINARISVDIKRRGSRSRFQRTAPSTYALREWGLEEYVGRTVTPKVNSDIQKKMTFNDAAEFVLDLSADHRPIHYREITDQIMDLELVDTEGQTPEATLYAQILTEIKRSAERNETPRFVKHGKGYIGLRKWMGEGLAFQIEQHNAEIRKKLLKRVGALSAEEFEQLIGRLLVAIGFESVEVTKKSGDGGIDVRGTLVVGDVIRTKMAVQVKKWKNNVQAPTIQQVRGSLGSHEQGLIITTSDFSSGARQEAERPDALPVGLMNGEQLVDLLIDYELIVRSNTYTLIQLDEDRE